MSKEGILKNKELFDAWLQGDTIEYLDKGDMLWYVIQSPSWNHWDEYRIQPKIITTAEYRRYCYLLDDKYYTLLAIKEPTWDNKQNDKFYSSGVNFVKWIDNDWIKDTVTL